MKNTILKLTRPLLFVFILFSSCVSKEKIIYLQNSKVGSESISKISYEPILQPDDVLMIAISAENQELAIPYNLYTVNFQSNVEIGTGQQRLQTFLIDKEGDIDFPLLGKIKLGGLTRIEAINKFKNLLEPHIKEATVNLRILNFKISLIGEVNKPGVYSVQSDRITLFEALSLAGDLTIYGNRNSIIIIRENEGVRSIETVDITKRDFINSSYYYLSQNDQVYVEPNKTKVNASVIGPNITAGLSALSLIITILALTIKF